MHIQERFLFALGGGARRGITPPPELPELAVECSKRLLGTLRAALLFPGIDIVNVCPSFKE